MVELKKLNPVLAGALGRFFEKIPDKRHFHPHPLTPGEAARLCSYTGKDTYVVAIDAETVLAYGMLRGWDEGFAVPSLGIAVVPEMRGHGLGELMMVYLHYVAKARDAPSVRLKVYPDNLAALSLYKKLGYRFDDESQEGQYVGRLEFHK